MQTVTTDFNNRANGYMRRLVNRALMSFPRAYDPSVSFFTIGVSTIGGADIIKGTGDVVAEWDKYQYDDYSYRLKSIEVTRQEEMVNSTTLAQADFVFENHDNYFTPNRGSAIQDYILPYRPVKLFGGFGDEAIPQFTGLTEKMPTIDEKSKTASFHAIDFMYSLFNRPLDQAVMYQDKRTDEILAELLVEFGISPTQYNFDVGFNIVKFAFFDKGSKFGDAVKELMEAEMGRFYMDEQGIIRFKNRQNYSTSPSWFFNESNIVDIQTSKQDDIINAVTVRANVREVQAKQKYWELQSAVIIPANGTLQVWADFNDPVTSVDAPEYITAADTSLYTTNTSEDGSGLQVNANISVVGTRFAKSYLMEFENTNAFPVYLTSIELFATPALVVKEIYVRYQDDASVEKYDERVLDIQNDYINNEGDAASKAQIIIDDYSGYASTFEITVKGNPALQTSDVVNVSVWGTAANFVITKIVNRWELGKFTQRLTVRKKVFRTFFTIGVSTIGGSDVIAP
jgi:hypothetical protein